MKERERERENAVKIDEADLPDLGIGRSVYSKAQAEEFLKFQNFQETRQAYLTETRSWPMGNMAKMGPCASG